MDHSAYRHRCYGCRWLSSRFVVGIRASPAHAPWTQRLEAFKNDATGVAAAASPMPKSRRSSEQRSYSGLPISERVLRAA